jgi:hypothetical protein
MIVFAYGVELARDCNRAFPMLNTKRRRCLRITFFLGGLIVAGFLAVPTPAQNSAAERAANLRSQLVEAQTRQAELQTRLQQLEDDLKAENIERSLAGVGSTHPEDLREARRRQLEIKKRGIQSQLDVLASSRTRLEAAIARADAESYHQSAGIGPNAGQQSNNAVPNISKRQRPKQRLMRRKPPRRY